MTSASLGNTSNLGLGGDGNKIAYLTPKMGGFQAGYSIQDQVLLEQQTLTQ